MDVAVSLRKFVTALTWHPVIGIIPMSCLLFLMFLTNTISYLVKNWYKWDNDIYHRIDTFRAVNVFLIVLLFCCLFLLTQNNLLITIDIIEESLRSLEKNLIDSKRETIVEKIRTIQTRQYNITYYGSVVYIIAQNIAPILRLLYEMFIKSNRFNDIPIEELPLPFPFNYPEQFKNVFTYILIFVLQAISSWYTFPYVSASYGTLMNSSHVLACELQLLRFRIEDMESNVRFNLQLNNFNCKENSESLLQFNIELENELRRYLRKFVKEHQNMYRKVYDVSKGVQGVSLNFTYGVAALLCLTLYLVVQQEKNSMKISELILLTVPMYFTYMSGSCGQEIINEDANLRDALYACNWFNKPEWFKKTLIIIIARCNKNIEIKPFGLYILNLNYFSTILNAAYSYFNMLRTLK